MSNNDSAYKAKQEWLERLMASDFAPATKVFAWGVFQRMYGLKITANPGSNTIYEDTKVGKSKHSDHRKKLAGCGAMSMRLVKNTKGDWDSYEYVLNLNWDGNSAMLLEGSHLQGITPGADSSTNDGGSYPQGTTLPPTGYEGSHLQGMTVIPTGSSNTTSNTSNNTTINTTNSTPPVAAEESSSSNGKEKVEDSVDSPFAINSDNLPLPSLENDRADTAPEDEEIEFESYGMDGLPLSKKGGPPDDVEIVIPDGIVSILEESNNYEEAVAMYRNPEFRSGRKESDKERAVWARDYSYRPKNAPKNDDGDEW